MARIPADIREYLQKHRKTKSIRWAIKYYNDNYNIHGMGKAVGQVR